MSSPPARRSLRIALVSNRFPAPDGCVATHVARLATALTAAGHVVTVLPDHVDVDDGHDIVHAHGSPDPLAGPTADGWRGPLVLSPHHDGAASRSLLERADAIVCTSATERTALLDRIPTARPRAVVVTHGVDVERLRATRPQPSADGRRLVLVAGPLDGPAHVDQVISALRLLRPTHRLEVWGDGPERPALEAQVARLGLRADVAFRDPADGDGRTADPDDRARALVSADCLVTMAAHEAPGTTLLEAAAVGIPIVASAIPAHVEAQARVGDRVRLVAPDAGVRGLAAAIQEATAEPRLPVDVPTWAEVAAALEDVYRRVLARRRALGQAPVPSVGVSVPASASIR